MDMTKNDPRPLPMLLDVITKKAGIRMPGDIPASEAARQVSAATSPLAVLKAPFWLCSVVLMISLYYKINRPKIQHMKRWPKWWISLEERESRGANDPCVLLYREILTKQARLNLQRTSALIRVDALVILCEVSTVKTELQSDVDTYVTTVQIEIASVQNQITELHKAIPSVSPFEMTAVALQQAMARGTELIRLAGSTLRQ
jgi:hypothetical protein